MVQALCTELAFDIVHDLGSKMRRQCKEFQDSLDWAYLTLSVHYLLTAAYIIVKLSLSEHLIAVAAAAIPFAESFCKDILTKKQINAIIFSVSRFRLFFDVRFLMNKIIRN